MEEYGKNDSLYIGISCRIKCGGIVVNKNYKKLASLVLCIVFLLSMCISVSAMEYNPYPIATKWTTKLEFAANSALNGTPSSINYKSNWISAFVNIMQNQGGSVMARDGFVDIETNETVYDNVTKTPGDYYLYVHQLKDSANLPMVLYFNSNNISSSKTQSHSNGGAIYSNAVYEFDIKLQPGEWSDIMTRDNKKSGYASVWGWDNTKNSIVEIASISFDSKDTTDMSWYPSYWSKTSNGFVPMQVLSDTDSWYKIRICIDVKNQKAQYFVIDTDGNIIRKSPEETFKNYCDYALTNLDIRAGYYRDFYLDNVSVTKESFSVGNITSTEENGKIQAVIPIANEVYALEGHGDLIPSKSPLAILAVYDSNNKMIGFDMQTVDFENHYASLNDKTQMFSKPLDFKNITLEVDKPNIEYTTKLYLWSSHNNVKTYLFE